MNLGDRNRRLGKLNGGIKSQIRPDIKHNFAHPPSLTSMQAKKMTKIGKPANHLVGRQDSRLSVASDQPQDKGRSQEDDDDNDEENIVIDMADEDEFDELDDDELQNGAGLLSHCSGEAKLEPSARYLSLEVSSQNSRVPSERVTDSITYSNSNNNNNNDNLEKTTYRTKLAPEAKDTLGQMVDEPAPFQVADLVWFDPNQLGYRIPGKVIDHYTGLGLLTVEGHAQPTVCDPSVLAAGHFASDPLSADCNRNLEHLIEERYNRLLLEAENEFQLYDLNEQSECYKSMKLRQPIDRIDGSMDLIDLAELSLESIVWNLKLRYKQDLVYTKCGHNILISMNPHKQLDKQYNLNQLNKYNFRSSLAIEDKTNDRESDRDLTGSMDGKRSYDWPDGNLLRWLLIQGSAGIRSIHQDQEEPHLFGMASEALARLLVSGKDQSFLLLGDSGSGKTETAKLLAQSLVNANRSSPGPIDEQILESMHLLESFGNARTQDNDNSSRFAKILEISFNLIDCSIVAAKTVDLGLLDRSRIVSQSAGERNYHIFYELLAGLQPDEKEKYGLQQAAKYFYLNQGNCCQLSTKEDAHDFRSLMASMQVLGFSNQEKDCIFRLLASILHLGNVYFHRKLLAVRSGKLASDGQCAGVEGVEVGSDTEVRWLSHLLQIHFDSVMRCLTLRTQEGGRARNAAPDNQESSADQVVTPLNIDQALDTRDAIARTLYTCLFHWLVQRVNAITNGQQNERLDTPIYGSSFCPTSESLCEFQPDRLNDRHRLSMSSRCSSAAGLRAAATLRAAISILDVFGFENLAENNFEQLCINYAAELIQYHAHRYLLRLEQAEYQRQRLKWDPMLVAPRADECPSIDVAPDAGLNPSPMATMTSGSASAVVNLLSKKPLGILALLDDECNFPKATDQSFVEKCHHNHTLNDNYQRSRLESMGHEFGVRHFRQQKRLVWYQVEGFIEKNRDTLRPDIAEMLMSSRMTLVVDMLRKLHRLPQDTGSNAKTLSRTYDGRVVSMRPRATTLTAKFQDSLQASKPLEAIGGASRPSDIYASLVGEPRAQPHGKPHVWFVLCLRPNQSKAAQVYDVAHVQEQARCLNLLDLAKVRKFGYPIRMSYGDFVRQYKCLVPQSHLDGLACARSLKAGGRRRRKSTPSERSEASESLKRAIKELCAAIVEFNFRSDESQLKQIKTQYQCGASKMCLNERLHLRMEQLRLAAHLQAVVKLQRILRGWLVRRELAIQRRAALIIQTNWRGWQARQLFWRQYLLIIGLQRHWRRCIVARRRKAMEEKRRLQRKQQQIQLQELQAQQKQLADQLRHRVQPPIGRQPQRRPGLDIPDQLAELYRLQRDWEPIHQLCHLNELQMEELDEREARRKQRHSHNRMSVPFVAAVNELALYRTTDAADSWELVVRILGSDLANELDTSAKYSLHSLLSKFTGPETPQFGYSRLPITRPFTWLQLNKRKSRLAQGCQSLDRVAMRLEQIELDAIAIYKLILRYIDSELQGPRGQANDRQLTSDQQAAYHDSMQRVIKFKLIADYIIHLCIKEPKLRDEVYLQLASQSWQNPRPRSVENAWKLTLNCLSCFGPTTRHVTRLLLKFANDHCCPKYRELVLVRLANYLRQPKLMSRQYPPTMLEYWANQEAMGGLAIPASCYMDDHALNGPALAPDAEDPDGALDSSLVNHSTKTFVRVAPWTSAESLAAAVLRTRGLPAANLVGWSLEVQHEGALGEMSSRLRGDDCILDHFGHLELVPDFANLIEEPRRSALDLPELNIEAPERQHREASMSEFSAPKRLSLLSQRSAESRSFGAPLMATRRQFSDLDLRRISRANSRADYYQRHPMSHSGADYSAYSLAGHQAQDLGYHDDPSAIYQTAGHCHAYQQPATRYPMQSHRRSLSMHELPPSSCSLLNERHFGAQPFHYATSYVAHPHYGPAHQRSELGGRLRESDRRGSLQRLSSSHYQQPLVAVSARRSQTPNSAMALGRASHYGYATGGSLLAEGAGRRSRPMNRTSNQGRLGGSQLQLSSNGRPRRSASSSSRTKPFGPSSDYASACSDYERVGGTRMRPAQSVKNPLVEKYKQSARQAQRQRLSQRKPVEPAQDTSIHPPDQNHYVGSSALSDTSEAPSLASHVRAIKVPQHNADLDQYLDDLFNPMLDDADLDELSDARSLAFSIRGVQLDDDLSQLCDPVSLATMIRGTDQPSGKEQEKDGQISPKFESILESLHQRKDVDDGAESVSQGDTVMEQLQGLNLDELKALNQKLEYQIQEAQSGRLPLSIPTDIPEPPPQPDFSTALDDLYSRAKTIRIGKIRWPPSEAAALPTDNSGPANEPLEVPRPPSPLPPADELASNSNVGKLKLSSEMKSKLELLTNQGLKESTELDDHSDEHKAEAGPAKGIVSKATLSLLQATEMGQDKVKKLNEGRRHLLQSQLMGSKPEPRENLVKNEHQSPNAQTGSKILAAKQLLAEAAGMTLDALDSNPCSQASSRRQSAAIQTVGGDLIERRFRVMSDELGPQSQEAINQRRAFYGKPDPGHEQIRNDEPPSQEKLRETDMPVERQAAQRDDTSSAVNMIQRQQELFAGPMASEGRPSTDQWVASSPDPSAQRGLPTRRPIKARPASQMRANELLAARREHRKSNGQIGRIDLTQLESKCLTYGQVDWQVKIRKEIFMPSEGYEDPLVVQLIFAQLVADVFNPRQWTRLNNKERAAIKSLMKDNSIGYAPSLPQIGQMQQVKRDLVRMARSFGLYFTRSYRALNFSILHNDSNGGSIFSLDSLNSSDSSSSGEGQNLASRGASQTAIRLMSRLRKSNNLGLEWIDSVAVHHSGLRLVVEERAGGGGQSAKGWPSQEPGAAGYRVLETLKFRDMTDVSLLGRHELLVSMRNGKKCWLISSEQATQLSDLLKAFHADYSKLTAGSSRELVGSKLAQSSGSQKVKRKTQANGSVHNLPSYLAHRHPSTGGHVEPTDREDALLASDDDHHGDHLKQRKTPASVNELRQKTHTDHDLADNKRALRNNLATNRGSSTNQESSRESNGGHSPPSPSAAQHNHSKGSLKHSTHTKRLAPPSRPSATEPGAGRKPAAPLGGGRPSDRLTGGTLTESAIGQLANQLQEAGSDCGRLSKSPGVTRRASLWQSSLSRMSNKFNIFTGGSQSRASTPGKGQPRARPQRHHDPLEAAPDNEQHPPVALDAWIETKVDFDDNELESECHSDTNNNSHQPDANEPSEGGSLRQDQSTQEGGGSGRQEDGKHSMLQFALYNFREAVDKYSLESRLGKAPAVDTGTLRGSLKFIESLRGSVGVGAEARAEHERSRRSSPAKGQQDWTWREIAEMVKWTGAPIRQSILKLPSEELNKRAVDCFAAVMQYMADQPARESSGAAHEHTNEVECVYLILMNCHNYPILRDEVYCQLMKQTTSNRSPSSDSCLRGWRLFAMLAAYFDCSNHLRPYLLKYLETAAYDKRRAYCSVASLCLQNLRKTFKYKGRKNVPSIEEIAAHSAGRNSKRQIYRLPGGTERVINTKSTTVVEDIIQEICLNMLKVSEPQEMLEFSLYCIADGDLYTMPLDRDEYILDVTTELIKNHQQYFLIFCRSVWHYPLRLDSQLYIEVIFNQIAPDYLEGLLLVLPAAPSSIGCEGRQPLRLRTKLVKEVARIAALLHRASGTDYMPHKDEVRYLLPKPIVAAMRAQRGQQLEAGSGSGASSSSSSANLASQNQTAKRLSAGSVTTIDTTTLTTPQKWVELVQNNWREMSAFDTLDAKAQFLDIVRHWPLFGSSFFAIKFIQRDLIQPMDFILALNKFGIQMLDTETHETIYRYPSNEVISTRKVRSEDGTLYLDLKCGNLMKRTIIRIQTDQAHEISRLIKQYIDIELMQQKQLQLQQQQQQQLE